MLWLVLAFVAALATSLTTIFAKIGVKDVNSNFATAYRTGIVILCCVATCAVSGSFAAFYTDGQQLAVFGAIRRSHGLFVVVLLPCNETGRREQSCADR